MDLETKFETACGDGAACPSDEIQATSDETSDGLDMNLVLAVLAVLILFTLVGLMVMRSRGDSGVEEMKWNNDMLPFNDTVANSMYGGAQDIFQQPVAHVAPVAQVAPVAHAPVAPAPAPVAQPAGPPCLLAVSLPDGPWSSGLTTGNNTSTT